MVSVREKAGNVEVPEELVRELRDVIARPVAMARARVPEELPEETLTPIHPLDVFARNRAEHSPKESRSRWNVAAFFSLAPWFLGAGIVIAGSCM